MKIGRTSSALPKAALAVALLMVLQVAGCAIVGGGDITIPIFCTASAPGYDWLAGIQLLLLVGFIPVGLASLAFARLRYPAIALGIAALSGLALQHMFLANGIFHCDAP